MNTYLITGGAGFIGSNYLEYCVFKYRDDMFICLDKLTYSGNLDNLNKVMNEPNFIFYKGDICERKLVEEIIINHHVDYIVNFAAESHVDNSIINPSIFLVSNVLGTEILLELALKHHIKRFHQVSTDEVYGDLDIESNLKFKEDDKLNPSSPYSASKASADLLVLAYKRTFGLNVTISRSSNNYGKYQHNEKFIPTIIHNALDNKKIPIYGNGLNIRNYIYVLDNVIAIDKIVRNGNDGSIYNISSDFEINNINLVKYLLKELGKDEMLISFVSDRLGHDLRYSVDNTKIKEELDFSLNYSFSDGIKKTIAYYKNIYGDN